MSQIEHLISNVNPIDVRAALFKKGDFDFIVKREVNGETKVHEKQREALKLLTSGIYEEIMFGGAAGGAKIVANEGVVLTPHGWKKGKNLNVGDLLNNPNGTVQRIIAIKPEIYVDQWTVYFSDGTSTDVGKEHLWQAWRGRKGRKINNKRVFGQESAEVIETSELKEWLDRGYSPQIPVCKPQKFNKTTNEKNRIDPYLLGVLLGDGCLTAKQITISSSKEDISHYLKYIGNLEYSIGKKSIDFKGDTNQWLKQKISLHKLNDKKAIDKFIPESYKWASIQDRFALIQGLMDTDGTSAKDKNALSYTTISKQLAEDVAFVIRSLGGIVTVSKNKAGYKDKNGEYVQCNDAYKLYIRIDDPDSLFRLERKKHGKFGKNLVQKRVVDVKITGKIRGRCITVSNPNGLYITNDFIVTHNSWTGCSWILFMAINYPGTRWFIARNRLKDILDSVLVTWKKVCSEYGFTDYKYNAQKYYIELGNGSHINLIEVKYQPSDPEFEDLGSTEYTGGWIEEVGETHPKAATALYSRTGRHLNEKYNLKKQLFYTCNPKKNWAKLMFYDPWKKGNLDPDKCFLPCLVTDNPFIPQDYVKSLRKMKDRQPSMYKRLYLGDWNYEDNPDQITDDEMIDCLWKNDHVPTGRYYLTVDAARFGSDLTVIMVWCGFRIVKIFYFEKTKTTEIEATIAGLRSKFRIARPRCVGDEDGVGGGVIDGAGIKGFKNNGRAIRTNIKDPDYRNLQVQCLYLLAEMINEGGIHIEDDTDIDIRQKIKEELSQIIAVVKDNRKLDLKPKSEIKADIGRSPDFRDCMMMRMYFTLTERKKRFAIAVPRKTI